MAAKRLSEKEMAGVLSADGPTRYEHFVKQVADWQLVWGLREDDGWVSMGLSSHEPAFPVWPHEAYAQLCATEAWASAKPTSIEVHEWVESWLPGLGKDGSQIAVFPTPEGKGLLVDPRKLRADLEKELSLLE